ncbi:twin-arginine translocation signal domain-containing protein [Aureimonas psammosilenae]|uniref:twin-arginine translocation signal domain-containing protein n=1 Tax=Aureimonas psammosilenae TaxID=2495496 RepID=UPI0012607792|nr:twin-arginine translocation signal domain-containing protein [Aureimonas psammosilenae]
MSKHPLATAAEGLPTVSRRRFLTTSASLGAAVTAGGVAMMAMPAEAVTPHDPLLALIQRYEAEEKRFNATHHATEEDAEADMEHLDELFFELRDNPPAATTEAGALAALRLTSNYLRFSHGGFEQALIAEVVAYFDGRA